ncbi:MAG: hypothetical protein KF681_00780 [Bdellovibrionaceae bacterium]|nr:hypothetical protein [Pseudobdellovibrionaceae bacterium]
MRTETIYESTGSTVPTGSAHRHLVCWRSAFAGLAIALVTFIGALALAIAFGGIGLSDGSTLKNAGIFAGVSVAVATVIAAFAGSYFSVRVASIRVDVLGSMQGLLVGGVFMIFVVFQVFSMVGTLGQAASQTLGATASMLGTGAAAAMQNPVAQEFVEDSLVVEDSLGGLNLKSDASVVATGTASRLLRGDTEAAKLYLANQAGLTPEQADQRIATLNARIDEAKLEARDAAATTLKTTGWGLFLVVALGMIASSLGGLLASVLNVRAAVDAQVPAERRRTLVEARV